jgi:hypothetical protein
MQLASQRLVLRPRAGASEREGARLLRDISADVDSGMRDGLGFLPLADQPVRGETGAAISREGYEGWRAGNRPGRTAK